VKLSDTVWGALLLALSLAVLWNVQGFPQIPGQNVGPAAFPGLLALLLGLCAVILLVRGVRQGGTMAALGDWVRSPRHLGNFLLAAAAPLFYIVAANRLGFLIVAPLILAALFLKLGVRLRTALPVAVLAAFVIHAVFYKLLRVSLPWGVLPIFY